MSRDGRRAVSGRRSTGERRALDDGGSSSMEERHGWVLATFLQRFAAYLIDSVLSHLPLTIAIVALVAAVVRGRGGQRWGRRRRTTGAYSSSC